jgi:cell division septation protein DedD
MLPKSVRAAIQTASANHPLALAARYNVDINELAVKIVEGGLLPTVNLTGSVNQQYNYIGYVGRPGQRIFQGGVGVQVNVPIYEGGIVYAQSRQAKEKLSEAKFLYEQQVNQINQAIEAAWGAWKEAGKVLAAAREQVGQAESALAGVREEAKIGLRTTWDILNALQTIVNARITLVNAQRDRTLYGFALLSAMGQLSIEKLDLGAPAYDPTIHFEQVKDQWIGLEAWDPPAGGNRDEPKPTARSFVANVQDAAAANVSTTDTRVKGRNGESFEADAVPSRRAAERRDGGEPTTAPLDIAPTKVSSEKVAHQSGSGWIVQIGASPDEKTASQLLLRARDALHGVTPTPEVSVQAVQKGGETLYRARFVGFDRESADVACKALKRSGFSCFTATN